jgi:hypothetical protein
MAADVHRSTVMEGSSTAIDAALGPQAGNPACEVFGTLAGVRVRAVYPEADHWVVELRSDSGTLGSAGTRKIHVEKRHDGLWYRMETRTG